MSSQKLRIAMIGCGLIGKKRIQALSTGGQGAHPAAGAQGGLAAGTSTEVTVACDLKPELAAEAAKLAGPQCQAITDPVAAVTSSHVDAVMIATTNATLAPLALSALKAGKHVLLEKPAAVSTQEIEELEYLARRQKLVVRVGYNHRYHPSFIKLRDLLKTEDTGSLMFIRGRYGHGGRVGYEKEWRARPELSGGGELIDQGVHLIDLAGSLMAPFKKVEGTARTFFWEMPVDDNAFMTLEDENGAIAWLHASCTEWKNLFSFEIYYQRAKFHIEGLGRSYGVEKLFYYKMLPQMGPPETQTFEFPGEDRSWMIEMEEFFGDIAQGRVSVPGLVEAKRALQVVEAIYKSSGYRK